MGSQFWWVYDLAIILIIVLTMISNGKRGFQKTFSTAISYCIAIVLAAGFSRMAATSLYENSIRETNLMGMEKSVEQYDAAVAFYDCISEQKYGIKVSEDVLNDYLKNSTTDFEWKIYNHIKNNVSYEFATRNEFSEILEHEFISSFGNLMKENMPNYAAVSMKDKIEAKPDLYYQAVQEMYTSDNSKDIAVFMEDTFVEDNAISVIQKFMFLISFFIFMFMFSYIGKFITSRMQLNIQRSIDHLGGTIMGVIEAIVSIAIVTVFINLVVLSLDNITILNVETINATYVFKFFYEHISLIV